MFFSESRLSEFFCLLGACFFGLSWVAMKRAMTLGLGPFTYNALRFTGSVCFLSLSSKWLETKDDANPTEKENLQDVPIIMKIRAAMCLNSMSRIKFELYFFGVWVGIAGFLALQLQQLGLLYIGANKSGFITSLFVVVTPLLEYCLSPCMGSQSNITWKSGLCIIISLFGMYLLSGKENEPLSAHKVSNGWMGNYCGEVIQFIAMLLISLQIIMIDVASKRVNCIQLTLVQFQFIAIFSVVAGILLEPAEWFTMPPFSEYKDTYPLSWALVLSVSLTEPAGYVFITLGQMRISPTSAAIILSMEGVATALFSFIFLGEKLSTAESFGSLLVFMSTLASSYTSSLEPANSVDSLDTSVGEHTNLLIGSKATIKKYFEMD